MAPRENVELFHLLFLRVLTSGADRANYRVKGGCNLRFWFRSVRYSEDLDLDVVVTARATLKNKIDRMLEAGPLPSLLKAQRMKIVSATAPKQTDTTQRWKLSLAVEGTGAPLHTKIELSRRPTRRTHAYEPADAELARKYRITAPLANHYVAEGAVAQKIGALAHRSETQARDVFDLHLLLSSTSTTSVDAEARADIPKALLRAMDVGYSDFQAQVVAFLEPEHRELHRSRDAWNQMQADVVAELERLA